MPFIKPRHIRALVRKDLGVIVTSSVYRAVKGEVIKQMEQKYKDKFMILNDYVEELKATNYGSIINVISMKVALDLDAVFDIIYICFGALKEGFLGADI